MYGVAVEPTALELVYVAEDEDSVGCGTLALMYGVVVMSACSVFMLIYGATEDFAE